MRDISSRLNRYRLSRYAPPVDPVRRRLRWAWVLGALWLAWIGLVSDHSLLRIWLLGRDNARARTELERVRAETAQLDAQVKDPRASRELAEHALRERNGMARPGEIVYRIRSMSPDSVGR
jgi:cell division protein FtsB